MNRPPSTSTTPSHPEADVLMGPPPVPTPVTNSKNEDTSEVAEKYKKLKRKYHELEEKQKDMAGELQRSGERNVKMRDERNILLDRIIELETQHNQQSGMQLPPHSAFPRALLNDRSHHMFAQNIRRAIEENPVEAADDLDPRSSSRHVGPLAEEQHKANIEPEPKDDTSKEVGTRRSSRRGKGGKAKESTATAPPPAESPSSSLVATNSGTRLRIRNLAPPSPSLEEEGSTHQPSEQASSSSATEQRRNEHSFRSGSVVSSVGAQAPTAATTPVAPDAADASLDSSNVNAVDVNIDPSLTTMPSPAVSSASVGPPISTTPLGTPILSNNPYLRGPTPGLMYPYPYPYAVSPILYSPHLPPMEMRPGSSSGSETSTQSKPRRSKSKTVASKSANIPVVPRDPDGKPMLPLNVGIMTVISLGEVTTRPFFHTERYIYPVGYEVSRRYPSTVDPNTEVIYHCTILDGGDAPKFQVIAADVPTPFMNHTATGAWSTIVKQANAIRNRKHSNSVSGPDLFGLGQNTIKHLIQELPNANRLQSYVWQNYVEGGPLGGRHAAVIPALPEEFSASTPMGAYYPNEREREMVRQQRNRAQTPSSTGGSVPPSPYSASNQSLRSHYPEHTRHYTPSPRQATASPAFVTNAEAPNSQPPSVSPNMNILESLMTSNQQPAAGVTIASIMNAYNTGATAEVHR